MTIQYNLTEADILHHQLYILSESKAFQKRRAKGRMFILLIYMITGMFIWQRNGPVTAALFYVICLPFYFLYRKLEARQYEKHISGFVHSQYKDSLQKPLSFTWDDEQITSSNGENEQKLPWLELETIVETSMLLILNFRNTNAIIIPKNNAALPSDFITQLQSKASSLGIGYEAKTNWKWK